MMDINQVMLAIMEYEEGYAARVQHFTKVYTYATMIGQGEGLDPETLNTLQVGAIMHDIGIKYAEAHFGRTEGPLQEKYGPAIAEEILVGLGAEQRVIDRVRYLIAHHHSYAHIDAIDYQILVEADFLVNMCENAMVKKEVEKIYRRIFKTKSGRALCRAMYDLTDDPIILGRDNHKTTFSHCRMADGIYGIQWPGFLPGPGRLPGWGYVMSYVVVGKEKALLVDTGFGNADIKKYIEENITELPLMVTNTHIHPDHAGGNGQFEVVYVGEHETNTEEGICFYLQPGQRDACQAVKDGGDYRFAFLKDEQEFNLGGRVIRVVEIPGHTPGSIAFFDYKTRILISGDAILKRVFYGSPVVTPFSVYRAALVKAKALPVHDIFSAHWPEPIGPDYIDRMIHLLDAFNPEKAEFAGWEEPGMQGVDLRMFSMGGEDFDDPEFVAISYITDQLDEIMK